MRYFEFTKTEYYALVSVSEEHESAAEKAAQIYLGFIGEENRKELPEGSLNATELPKEAAFYKFMRALGNEEVQVKEALEDFDNCIDGFLLIDGSLI